MLVFSFDRIPSVSKNCVRLWVFPSKYLSKSSKYLRILISVREANVALALFQIAET